mmetsp:Transcript_3045/g.10066  ORF Transcript_3045/g.10066 Transcript_3045/m.10066 type:complete len:201 (+) Transcript_3045:976-1578(+)
MLLPLLRGGRRRERWARRWRGDARSSSRWRIFCGDTARRACARRRDTGSGPRSSRTRFGSSSAPRTRRLRSGGEGWERSPSAAEGEEGTLATAARRGKTASTASAPTSCLDSRASRDRDRASGAACRSTSREAAWVWVWVPPRRWASPARTRPRRGGRDAAATTAAETPSSSAAAGAVARAWTRRTGARVPPRWRRRPRR